MTQFTPPPPPVPQDYASYRYGPAPWSVSAVSAFVASILGFLGIPALIGLVLGIVGIFSTKDGRKRGFGLAVAAIPISLLTGLFFCLVVAGAIMMMRSVGVIPALKASMSLEAGDLHQAAASLREIGSPRLIETVSQEGMEAWLSQVNQRYGRLTDLRFNPQNMKNAPGGLLVLDLDAKFVNGPATVRMTVDTSNPFRPKIADLEVGEMSLREMGQGDKNDEQTKAEEEPGS